MTFFTPILPGIQKHNANRKKISTCKWMAGDIKWATQFLASARRQP